MTDTSGWVAPGFEGVREVFEANFADGLEVGAAFAAHHRGRKVVDLWGGTADSTTGRPWLEDTLVLVYSTTKGITALCANRLAQLGPSTWRPRSPPTGRSSPRPARTT